MAKGQNSGIASTEASDSDLIPRNCATMDVNDPLSLEALEEVLAPQVAAYIQSRSLGNNPEAVYTIPTVVHVIHNSTESVGSGRNIANARIQEQMTILNDDFRRTNADATNTPSHFTGVAADSEINFCLITRYPSGHPNAGQLMPEYGVDRVSATSISGLSNTSSGYSTSTVNNTIKPQTSWNPNEVMNIWVCQLQSGLLGYATFPNSGSSNKDGTVMGYQYFGLTSGPYGKGRTTTHEVGHWLGLYHIWGDDGGSCSGSDLCADTPNQGNATGGCPSGVQTDNCTGGNGIMYQNYMDYSYDACMNIFTQDQKARMQSVMASQPRRSTLNGFSATLCSFPVSVDERVGKETISIFPNPSNGDVNVVLTSTEDAQIAIFNMVGEVVYSNNTLSSTNMKIDMSNKANGVYFVKVSTAKGITTKKILLTK